MKSGLIAAAAVRSIAVMSLVDGIEQTAQSKHDPIPISFLSHSYHLFVQPVRTGSEMIARSKANVSAVISSN